MKENFALYDVDCGVVLGFSDDGIQWSPMNGPLSAYLVFSECGCRALTTGHITTLASAMSLWCEGLCLYWRATFSAPQTAPFV